MANSRPIRRGRVPFRRGRRWTSKARPKRWNAVATGLSTTTFSLYTVPPILGSALTAPAPAILVSGQVDVEPWADDQEVTVDRIIGNIGLRTEWTYSSDDALWGVDYMVKLGILVHEEVTQDVSQMELNMFDQETMEDYEWMWLWTGLVTEFTNNGTRIADVNVFSSATVNIPVDIKNRRKVGQSDELLLFAQYARLYDFASMTESVQMSVDLRTILMSR